MGSGAEPPVRTIGWSGGHWQSTPEAGGILMSDSKNKIETKKINSHKSQMEKIGTKAKRLLNQSGGSAEHCVTFTTAYTPAGPLYS